MVFVGKPSPGTQKQEKEKEEKEKKEERKPGFTNQNSLASLAEGLEIISRHKTQDLAYSLKFDRNGNPDEDSVSTQAMSRGTKVIVKNLFKDIPVRLKVCKKDKTVGKRLGHVRGCFWTNFFGRCF
jgi:hypothetical protein